jgi:23S rRNA A1618 N6-methylase RlmF
LNESNFESTWGKSGQPLVESMVQGENFAIVAIVVSDLKGNEFFFIILCNKPFFTFKEDFNDVC